MIAFFYISGLILAAVCVSLLGAAFSISGLAKLFTGASLAVTLMAGSLELAKFVVAAFLHRAWEHLHFIYKTYLVISVVVLSLITSMGIFGFLSDAYQNSSSDLLSNQVKIDALKAEQARNTNEVARIQQALDEIPVNRITKKMAARKEAEPAINSLYKRTEQIAEEIKQYDLKVLEIKNKVGPIIYIAKAFQQDIDTIVKWLILVFVAVFDPLAICLVIAIGEALKLKDAGFFQNGFFFQKNELMKSSPLESKNPTLDKLQNAQTMKSTADEVIEMRFIDESEVKNKTG